jgi:hypothetical protein
MAVALLITTAMLGSLGQAAMLPAALGSGAVCWLAAGVALEPIRRASRGPDVQRVLAAALAAMGIRLGVSLLGLLALLGLAGWPPRETALWTLGWYLLLLVVEVVILVRYFNRLPGATQATRNDADASEQS